jgi:enterochelin esterase family protein
MNHTSSSPTLLITIAGLFAIIQTAVAQPASPAVISPEVHTDRTVTFRLRAPRAERVTVNGDFWGTKSFPMSLDPDFTNGVWSVTTPQLEPDIYAYVFNMDGATLVDPVNTFVRVGAWAYMSQVYVPGERADFLAVRNVPHGTVHEHWYHNQELNTERRALVYTPPGYSSSKTYPVLYLLHGASDDEAFWTSVGRANFIMDNLLAESKTKPALIVMPFGHASRTPPRRGGGPGGTNAPAAGLRGSLFNMSMLENDLKQNLIPLVERTYRVGKKPTQRAIAGLSMGGSQSLVIGLNNPDLFAYVGAFSSALRGNVETNFTALLADPKKSNKNYKLIWIGCGERDGLLAGNTNFVALLKNKGINHEWTASPGYAHEWTLWRRYLHEVLQKFFKD